MTPLSRARFIKNGIFIGIAVLLLGGSFYAGLYAGTVVTIPGVEAVTTLSGKEDGKPGTVDFSTFWKAWNIVDQKFVSTHVHSKSFEGLLSATTSSTTIDVTATTSKVTDQERVYGAIQGMLATLDDPYTVFFPPEELKDFEGDVQGNFEGVGMEVGIRDGYITVVSPLKGSPAEASGIMTGDRIIKVDNKTIVQGATVEEVVHLIRGKGGTKVTITALRPISTGSTATTSATGASTVQTFEKTPREFTITRATIQVPTIETETKIANGEKTFIIKFYTFTATSPNLFRNALKEFIASGARNLIIDLRGNPGGYLDAAVDVASWFLPQGKVIVTEDFGKKQEQQVFRSKGYDVFNNNLRLAILIDGGSASASEILAGALREQGKAIIVGEKSFGKGSVQELIPLTNDTSIKVTVARWLTPKGNSISNNGIIPDVEVKRTADDVKAGVDPVVNKAIEALSR